MFHLNFSWKVDHESTEKASHHKLLKSLFENELSVKKNGYFFFYHFINIFKYF